MASDFPVALADTELQLPGWHQGAAPHAGPAGAVAKRLRLAQAYRLFATGDRVTAGGLGPAVLDVVPVPEHAESTDTAARAFEARVAAVVERLAAPGQPQAFGKWAFWTGVHPGNLGGSATDWAWEVMVREMQNEETKEGVAAWAEKRKPEWKT